MQITDLEQSHGDFYVPTFVIKVGGEDVLRDLYLPVSAVSVNLKAKAAGRFSFTVASAFDWEAREFFATQRKQRVDLLELFAFGSPVAISLGYGDPARLAPMLTGLITEITTDFTAGSTPGLTISGYDGLYPLMVGTNTRHWEDKPDSVAVAAVARSSGLSADVSVTRPIKEVIDQNNENDLAFLEKLAKRNGATFYHRDNKLVFGPRRNGVGSDVELEWGKGLLGFSPEAKLARQIAEVKVHGRSAAKGEAIVGRASSGEESGRDPRAQSGAQRVVTALSRKPVLNLRAAVRTQEEADARARSVLEERAQKFLTGSGESIGAPEIVPDTNIAINGLGRAFSKTYYVCEAIHKIDSGGYRTSFTVEETTV